MKLHTSLSYRLLNPVVCVPPPRPPAASKTAHVNGTLRRLNAGRPPRSLGRCRRAQACNGGLGGRCCTPALGCLGGSRPACRARAERRAVPVVPDPTPAVAVQARPGVPKELACGVVVVARAAVPEERASLSGGTLLPGSGVSAPARRAHLPRAPALPARAVRPAPPAPPGPARGLPPPPAAPPSSPPCTMEPPRPLCWVGSEQHPGLVRERGGCRGRQGRRAHGGGRERAPRSSRR